ncbi:MAG: FdhF/YdeP family oxidoreductase [Gammaproteobacteria bacterium]|nr:FdhF/YdeP family oxidoreductase [Gammaproteobacteria bacterium]
MTRRSKEKISEPREVAGGITAVVNALRHALFKAGPVRGTKALLKTNQTGGFDCPGCGWPEAEKRSVAEFCENGAKAVADEATSSRVTAEFFARYSVAELRQKDGRWLNAQGRLCAPVVLREGDEHYSPIAWDDAFDLIAAQLRMLRSPDEAVFYTSGRTSNEAAFLYQLLARRLGTNNLPDCSNLCHESSGRALTEVLGSGKGTVTLEDFELADAIFIAGQNPGSNHPRMLATLQRASHRGAHIVSINPLDETGLRRFRNPQKISGYAGSGTLLADLHIPVRINGDVALFQAIAKALFDREKSAPGSAIDRDFIARHTAGFDAYRDYIRGTVWGTLTRVSGVDIDVIRAAAEIMAESRRVIFCWAMGLTQHKNAVANIQEIVNLLLLGGHFGRAGSGACPVRGHSNVQGDRTMGIWEKPSNDFLDSLQREFRFRPPEKHGLDTVDSIHAMRAGKVKVFMAMGGNYVSATPDTEATQRAMTRCRLSVQISTKLNRSHLYTGKTAIILPALSRTEMDIQNGQSQFVSVENSMGVVRRSAGVLNPLSEDLRSEVRIVCEIGKRMFGAGDPVKWDGLADNYDGIREHISRVIPGFEDYNKRLEEENEFALPHPVRDQLRFQTVTKKAHFTVHGLEETVLEDGQFLLTSLRSHDQFNTTVYSDNDRYRGIHGSRQVVLANAADIRELGLSDGMHVAITSHFRDQTRMISGFRLVAYDIPRGCLAAYYPEINPLVPLEQVARISNTPAYKSLVVSLKPAAR